MMFFQFGVGQKEKKIQTSENRAFFELSFRNLTMNFKENLVKSEET
jgi:hypothetical protein